MSLPSQAVPVSYVADVKPLFREQDRTSMRRQFDLWSHDDVSEHTPAILARLEAGTKPRDAAWPPDHLMSSDAGSRQGPRLAPVPARHRVESLARARAPG